MIPHTYHFNPASCTFLQPLQFASSHILLINKNGMCNYPKHAWWLCSAVHFLNRVVVGAKEVEVAKEVAKGAALKEVVLVEQVPSEGYVWLLGTETYNFRTITKNWLH